MMESSNPLYSYIMDSSFHSLCLFVKLFPAAIVSKQINGLLVAVNDKCSEGTREGTIDADMLGLLQLMRTSEEDMGLKILGVKITLRVTWTIFTTIVTFLVAVVRFAQQNSVNHRL